MAEQLSRLDQTAAPRQHPSRRGVPEPMRGAGTDDAGPGQRPGGHTAHRGRPKI